MEEENDIMIEKIQELNDYRKEYEMCIEYLNKHIN